jgi:Helix-turn-helix domain
MSINAVKWALRAQNLSHIKKLVLTVVAECHNDKTGDCFPSQKHISEVLGQTERSIRSHLAELESDGFVTREYRYDRHGHRTSDSYTLHFDVKEPTGKHASGSLPENMLPVGDASLPEKSDGLPEKIELTTGNLLSGTVDEPESITGIVEPEKKESAVADAPALALVPADVITAELVDPIETEFNESFWPRYPKKHGRKDALKAYIKARKRATLAQIMSGLDTYIHTKEDWRQWKDPAAWLNGERWNDEPAPSQSSRGSWEQHVAAAVRRNKADALAVVGGVQ